jgi:ribonucleoside-diphosphate reductase alpha chain
MSLRELSKYTFTSKYAKYIPDKNRRETWNETIDRVKNMHLKQFPQIADDIEWAFDRVHSKLVLPAMRTLQYGGDPILKNNCRNYNCAGSYCDRIRFFQEIVFVLLSGTGAGFSVQKHHIAKLPPFNVKKTKESKVFVVPDTIEGWSDCFGVLISSYVDEQFASFPEYSGYNVDFDFSKLRPKGAKISSGGKSPGYEPLYNALIKCTRVIDERLKTSNKLRPIDAYDIVMHSSDCVISGGVRRSACISFFSIDDEEMMLAKTGNWFNENPQRGRSNNSVLLLRDSTSKEDFDKIIKSTQEFGEPGFSFASSLESLFNPCHEICFYAYDEEGNSGWQFCNLTIANGKKLKTKEIFKEASRASAIIGTCQAAYTSFPYLGSTTESIVRREALLGCSMTGIMENPDVILNPDTQKEMAQYILDINEEFAAKININPCARATCIKPEGSSSAVLGTSSGIHPHHSRRYFRRVQANKLENVFNYFSKYNPQACEESVWSANKTDAVITFCVEVEKGSRLKNDVDAIQLLDTVKLTQQNWVEYGTRHSHCTQDWLRNSVSNTISVRSNEWNEVSKFIYDNRQYYAGVSLLSDDGDKDYPQAPFCTVYTSSELLKTYGDGVLFCSGLIEKCLRLFNGNLWRACDYINGVFSVDGKDYEELLNKAVAFSFKYFNGDIKKMSYALKDVFNLKLWNDLNRDYQEIEYTKMIEDSDNTNFSGESACAGGKCEII